MSLKAFFKSFQFTNKRKKSKIKQTNNKKVNLTKYFMLPRNCIVYNICLSGKKVFSFLLLQRFNSNNEFPYLELKTNPNNLQICTIFDSELCDAKNKFRIIKDNFKISGFFTWNQNCSTNVEFNLTSF